MDRHFKRQKYNHGEFHFVQKSWRAQASEYTERSKVLQRKDAASSKYFYQRREKEDGKGKESRAGEPGAGAAPPAGGASPSRYFPSAVMLRSTTSTTSPCLRPDTPCSRPIL